MASTFRESLPDLTGKVVLITGPTSGIGYIVARDLLRKGATVYLAARNESKAVATISRLEAEGLGPGNGKAIWHKFELDNPHDVKKSAEEFLARESRLDILINNAASLSREYAMGPFGVQDIVTINYISTFLFTKLLLPLLKKTAQLPDSDVRIVNLGSEAYKLVSISQFQSKADLNGPTTSDSFLAKMKRYGFSKLLVVLWSSELARRLKADGEDQGSNILVVCLHPGSAATEGNYGMVSKAPWPFSVLLRWVVRWRFISPEEGASAVLVGAAQPELRKEKEKYHGSYLLPVGKLASTTKVASDEGLAKELWGLTGKILADEGL